MSDLPRQPGLVGFVLHRVPGIRPAYIPAIPGLTVLYGLNGAGKSRILEAVRSVWTGQSSGVTALVRVPHIGDPELWSDAFTVNLVRAWRSGSVVDRLGVLTIEGDFEEIMSDALREQIQPLNLKAPDPYLGPLATDRLRKIHDEVLDQRLVAVTPRGYAGRPSWTVCFAAIEEPAFPAISAELRRIRDGYVRLEEDAPVPFSLGSLDGQGISPWYGPEDQLTQLSAFEWVGESDTPGPLIGLAVRGDDRSADFQMTYLGIDRPDIVGEGIQSLLLKTLVDVGVQGKRPSKVSTAVKTAVKRIERQANHRYSLVLRDAPALTLTLKPIHRWFSEDGVEWTFGPNHLPLDSMSTAQRTWADWAITTAIQSFRNRRSEAPVPSLSVMDEPEGALHRSAEAHMARALNSYALEEGRQVIVATHSPDLIDAANARVLEVSRSEDSRDSRVSDLRPVDLKALEALGLNPSDLLRRQRGFLLLEGLHDEVLIKTWIGPELDGLRVEILPLRGASKLPGTVESRVLFDFSSAHVFVVLDNIARDEVAEAWLAAQVRSRADGHQVAGDELRARMGRKPEEREFLGNWLSRALKTGCPDRVTPYGLEERDIIEYLPASALVPEEHDWRSLRAEHARAVEAGDKRRDFKAWLTGVKKARITPESLHEAALDTPTPKELEDFLTLVRTTLAG